MTGGVLLAVLAGTLFSCLVSVLPGLHVYNLIGFLIMAICAAEGAGAQYAVPFSIGLVTGWSILNTLSSVLFGAPDESAVFTVLPGQKYLMQGRGHEAVMLIGTGGLVGVLVLVFLGGPLIPQVVPYVRRILMPHTHWILWVVITFMLMSEWPQGGRLGDSGLQRFFDAWRPLVAGLLTFFLSGLLGFILLYRSPVSADSAFQNIMPAFVGLFTVPWCLLNLISGTEIPSQRMARRISAGPGLILRSAVAGGLGGGFAAFFPAVTGGVGGMLAGHAAAQRDERVFMMSQGVSRMVYYAGAMLLFFVPGTRLVRGGASWMLQGVYEPSGWSGYFLALGCIAVSGALAWMLLSPMTRFVLWAMKYVSYRRVSATALLVIVVLVYAMTGWAGLFIAAVATGIGLIPVLFGSRRLNCLGILLLPIACNMSGLGGSIAALLGLI